MLPLFRVFGQVRSNTLCGRLHSFLTLFPVGRADFAVGLNKVKCINHAQRFFNIAAQRQVVDYGVANNTFLVNQEQTAQCNRTAKENAV